MTQTAGILEILYDRDGQFVWMDELARSAGVAAGDLLDALDAIARRGHCIERSPAHGVRLVRPTVLDSHLIERGLGSEHVGRHVICFPEVDSTMDVAFDSAGRAGDEALVVTAEVQHAGRGRMGRRWICPASAGVLASVLLAEGNSPLPHEQLTLAAGLAVAEGIERASGVGATLAWPNDVLIGPAKVAGVLVETRAVGEGGRRRTVVGLGVNVNASPPRDEVDREATCLSESLGHPVERIEVCRAVLQRLDAWIEALAAGKGDDLHRLWLSRCGMVGRRESFRWAGQTVTGRVLDLSPLEGLIVETDDGRRLHLPAAETTVLSGPDAAL